MFCAIKPVIRRAWQLVIGPVPVFFLVRGINDPGNMAGTGQNESHIAAVNPGAPISRFPFSDMVLAGGKEEGRYPDGGKINAFTRNREGIRLHQSVMQVHFPKVVAVHSGGEVGAVGIPVQQVEGFGFQAFEVVVGPVGPEQIVFPQQIEGKGHGPAIQVAFALHGSFDTAD